MEPKDGPPPTSPRGAEGGGGAAGGGGGGGGGGGALRLGAKPAAGSGSATTTVVAERVQQEAPVLRLVLEPRPHVRWDERVVDNEHMNKKSSKRASSPFDAVLFCLVRPGSAWILGEWPRVRAAIITS
jgi:hypothetical protein